MQKSESCQFIVTIFGVFGMPQEGATAARAGGSRIVDGRGRELGYCRVSESLPASELPRSASGGGHEDGVENSKRTGYLI